MCQGAVQQQLSNCLHYVLVESVVGNILNEFFNLSCYAKLTLVVITSAERDINRVRVSCRLSGREAGRQGRELRKLEGGGGLEGVRE